MSAPKRYTEEVKAEAVRRYMAGESSPKIAADIGCMPGTVMDWVNRSFEHNTKRSDDKMENTVKETPAAAATATDVKQNVSKYSSYLYCTTEQHTCQVFLNSIIELADDIIGSDSTEREEASFAGQIKGFAFALRTLLCNK
jgi:transposase-like protein